jgi:hypothetical protein
LAVKDEGLAIMLAFAALIPIWQLIRGFRSGIIAAVVPAPYPEASRAERPVAFWGIVAFNVFLSMGMLTAAIRFGL